MHIADGWCCISRASSIHFTTIHLQLTPKRNCTAPNSMGTAYAHVRVATRGRCIQIALNVHLSYWQWRANANAFNVEIYGCRRFRTSLHMDVVRLASPLKRNYMWNRVPSPNCCTCTPFGFYGVSSPLESTHFFFHHRRRCRHRR